MNKTGCQKYGALVPTDSLPLFILKCFQIAEIRVHLIVSYLSYSVVFFRRNSVTFQPVYWFWKIFWLQMIYLSWKLSAEGNFTCKIFYQPTKTLYLTFSSLFPFFEDRFCCGMVKRKNFLHVVDLLFVTRFLKYLFRLHYHEQCPINNIQVKCFQIGQNVCDIFWICFHKLRGLLISSFWSSDSDFW